MQWYNPPPTWQVDGDTLYVTAGAKTDFWRTTHYGFVRDNGHFYYDTVGGEWEAEVQVRGAYAMLYDQAGMMVRIDEANWLKCGIEYVDGVHYASVVVTRDFSDWSVVRLAQPPHVLGLRLKRSGDTVEVLYAPDGAAYTMLRLAYLPPVAALHVGVMCAAPQGNGFAATFTGLRITQHEPE